MQKNGRIFKYDEQMNELYTYNVCIKFQPNSMRNVLVVSRRIGHRIPKPKT